jgi:predicted transcriptional regulator
MKTQVNTIRMPRDQAEKLHNLAERFGVTDAVVIRWAVEALLDYAAAHGGTIHLPLDLSTQWKKVVERAEKEKSALEALESDPANLKFTAQTLADQESMRADVAAKKTKTPPRK